MTDPGPLPQSDRKPSPVAASAATLAWAGAAIFMAFLMFDLAVLGRWDGLVLAVGVLVCAFLALRVARAPAADPAPPPAVPEPTPPQLEDLAPLVNALPEAALLVDRTGRIIAANAEVRRQLQFNAAGVRLPSVLRQPEVLDAVEAAAIDGATRTVEYETASRFEEHFRVYVSPIVWGDQSAALAIFNDRTAMINSERMRADFLANASHELKTPVASLSLLVETVAGPARGDVAAQDRFLPMMRTEIDRMRRLIEDLLSLSKIELNEHVPPAGVVDVAQIAEDVAQALRPLASARGVTITVHAPMGQALVTGDAFQLAQVAKNLLENAVKFSPAGRAVVVEIATAEGRDAAIAAAGRQWEEAAHVALLTPPPRPALRYAYLRVSDEGGGIPRRHLPRLGERFYRVERSDGLEKAGTGLGLAIVKHILNRHRAGFLVESEIGVGSAFAAYFELSPTPTSVAVTPDPQDASAAEPTGSASS